MMRFIILNFWILEDKEILKSGYRETEKYLQGNTSSNSGRCLVCDIMEARRKRPKSSQALKEELSIVNSSIKCNYPSGMNREIKTFPEEGKLREGSWLFVSTSAHQNRIHSENKIQCIFRVLKLLMLC